MNLCSNTLLNRRWNFEMITTSDGAWELSVECATHDQEERVSDLWSKPMTDGVGTKVGLSDPTVPSGRAITTSHVYDQTALVSAMSSAAAAISVFVLLSLAPPEVLSDALGSDADGSVSIYDADPFVLLKSVKIHKKTINSMSVHPSGKIALTVGHDQCMALVNLVRGRRSFYCKIGKEASLVQFDESGDRFSMVVDEKVSIHEAEDAKLIVELDNTKKVLCAASGANGILYTGGEDRNISAWDTVSGKLAYSIENAHAARVKGIVVLSKSNADSGTENPYLVASAASDGVIRVWDVRKAVEGKPLTEVHTKSRLTCLAGSSIRSLKRQRNEKPNTDENLNAAVES
ncbi:hypothetical protein SASPL_124188 [Salvia splendens]|uniref:Protein MAK11 n=1 Tax=Salvia splendens TaxID=180675 RepID=A0A8X8XRA4_SALSN|nr:hypothetical protein SASPL_124188 [Salvia splendens]